MRLVAAMTNNSRSYDELISMALNGLREVQSKDPDELKQWFASHTFLPSSIPVGAEGSVYITSEGYTAIRELGRAWQANDATRGKLLSRAAAEELAVYALAMF
jgi:hypothetical protein